MALTSTGKLDLALGCAWRVLSRGQGKRDCRETTTPLLMQTGHGMVLLGRLFC